MRSVKYLNQELHSDFKIYFIVTEIYARILQWIKAVRRLSPVKFHRSRCRLVDLPEDIDKKFSGDMKTLILAKFGRGENALS